MKKITKVVVVGGGTAGWMAAAAFAKTMKNVLSVTLIESDEIATVGVGEATVPPLQTFHRLLEIKEQEFMSAVKGTFKLGINFENWKNIGEDYFHPFGATGLDCWAGGFHNFWLRGKKEGSEIPYKDYSMETKAALANKFAHLPNTEIYYAYHMDAGQYAKYLRKLSEENGATRIEGKIGKVNIDPDSGYITSVEVDKVGVIEGDLFIDCSGFRGLLIEQALHTGYEDWSHWLPCDSAVAVQTKSVGPAKPYTRSIAHPFGWQWQIPLQHRVGNGLVFCSRYISDEDAKKVLLENVQGEVINEPKIIKYRTGQRRKQWNKNCIAVGLASGFIEPLESTSIHLIQKSIVRLLQMFPYDGITQAEVDEFNEQTKFDMERIRDFIIAHYKVTERNDSPFWRYCKGMPIPDSLEHKIRLFSESAKIFRNASELFAENSWVHVLMGQGVTPQSYHPVADVMPKTELDEFLKTQRMPIQRVLDQLPTHQEYVDYYCKAGAWE